MHIRLIVKIFLPVLLLLFFRISIAEEDPLKNFHSGRQAFEKNRFKTAEKYLKKFIRLNPYEYEVRDAYYYRAVIARKNKDYLKSISLLNILVKRFPHSRYRKIVYYYLGENYYKLVIYNRAEINLQQYLKLEKEPGKNIREKINANMKLALIYKDRLFWQKAVDNYHAALLLNEKLKKVSSTDKKKLRYTYYQLGMLYADKIKDKKLAYYYLQKYLSKGGKKSTSVKYGVRRISIRHLGKNEGLPDDTIADIKVDGDDVWIATWTGGLMRYSRSTDRMQKIRLPSDHIRSLYVDHDKVYITSYDGIYIYNKKNSRPTELGNSKRLFSLAQKVIKDDRFLYFSTLLKGVIKYDIYRKTIVVLDKTSFLGTNMVYSMAANHRYLAFGTLYKGAIVIDKKKNKTHYINKSNGLLKGNNIKALLIDGRYIWIGVHSHGIYRYDLERRKSRFYNWGVPYPTIITKRNKEIWIGSSGHGIRIFNQESEKVEKLRAIEGLSSNEINLIQIENDYAWIGYLDKGIDILYRPEIE